MEAGHVEVDMTRDHSKCGKEDAPVLSQEQGKGKVKWGRERHTHQTSYS